MRGPSSASASRSAPSASAPRPKPGAARSRPSPSASALAPIAAAAYRRFAASLPSRSRRMSAHEALQPRTPQTVRPPRISPLASVPLFFKLQGKRVVVAGGNAAAAWKAELLSAAGATVEVWAPGPCADMCALADDPPGGPVVLQAKAWDGANFAGAELVVGAADDMEEARRLASAAQRAGVPVNVIDRPAFSTFCFGAIVNRSPLIVGISTDGAAPVFAQAIRSRIEALIPRGFAAWAATARRWREAVKSSGLSFAGRRRFWQIFTAHAAAHPGAEPAQSDFGHFLAATREEGAAVEQG